MNKTTKTLLVGAGATGVALAVHKFSKTKINPYILIGGVLIATIGAYMIIPVSGSDAQNEKNEVDTSSFDGTSKLCLTKKQLECLSSDETKRKLLAILKECGLSAEQIQAYLKANKRFISKRIC
jgi:hypothetical protein